MFASLSLGSISGPTLTALYGPSLIPTWQDLNGTSASNRVLGPATATFGDAASEIMGNNALQMNFQAQQLTTLVTMLATLMHNRGLLQAQGSKKKKDDKIEKADGAQAASAKGHSQTQGASSSSGGAAGSPGQAVERQGKQIGAQIAGKFDAMVSAAAKDGVKLTIVSGLRTRAEQEKLYAAYKNGTGNLAAKPGTSNHESGEAIDFGDTPGAYAWLKKNSGQFGFFNKIASEPWHYSLTGT